MEELNKLQLWEFATQALIQDFSKKIGEEAGQDFRPSEIQDMARAVKSLSEAVFFVRGAHPDAH